MIAAQVLLQDLNNIYVELEEGTPALDALSGLRGTNLGSALLAAAHAVHEASVELSKPDDQREAEYRDRNRPFLEARLKARLGSLHEPHEAALVADALDAAGRVDVVSCLDARRGILDVAVSCLDAHRGTPSAGGQEGRRVDARLLQKGGGGHCRRRVAA